MRIRRLKALGQPDLDHGLPRPPQFAGFAIQRVNHPCWEINIHPLVLLQHAPGFGQVQRSRDVGAIIKLLFELFSFYKVPPLLCVRDARLLHYFVQGAAKRLRVMVFVRTDKTCVS